MIENKNGSLCSTYPSKLIVPVYEIGLGGEVVNSSPLSDAVLVETKSPSKDIDKQDVNFPSRLQDVNRCSHVENKSIDEEHLLDKAFACSEFKENIRAPTFSAVVAKSVCKKSTTDHNGTPQGITLLLSSLIKIFKIKKALYVFFILSFIQICFQVVNLYMCKTWKKHVLYVCAVSNCL